MGLHVTDPGWEEEQREKKWGRASRYALGRLTAEDAQTMICELEEIAGWASPVTLSVEDIVSNLKDAGYDHPKLEEWAGLAIAKVAGYDWSNEHSSATDSAEELVFEYASDDGVDLKGNS